MTIKKILPATVALLLLAFTGSAMAAPKMTLSEPSFDFGFVPQNAKIAHVFWISNSGDDELKILKVVPGCGCTKAPLEKSELMPGDSSRLEIIFSTKKYTSQVAKSPKIETNEGPPAQKVLIRANVVAKPEETYPIKISPFRIDLTRLNQLTNNDTTFSITNVSDQKLEIKLVDLPADVIALDLPKEIAPGESITGRLALTDQAYDLMFEKSITIELSDKKNSRFTIPVSHYLKSTLTNVKQVSSESKKNE